MSFGECTNHLPLYHPVAASDAWWVQGIEEWTNARGVRQLPAGYQKPHLLAELEDTDLSLKETRQAGLVGPYGNQNCCRCPCWFEAKRLGERPVDEALASMEPEFPFLLCRTNNTRKDESDSSVNFRRQRGLTRALTDKCFRVRCWLHHKQLGMARCWQRRIGYVEFAELRRLRELPHPHHFLSVFSDRGNMQRRGQRGITRLKARKMAKQRLTMFHAWAHSLATWKPHEKPE